MKQILIATDGSPSAQEAVDVGLELAKEQGADVTFVHVTFSTAEEPLTRKFVSAKAVVGSRSAANTTVNPIRRRI
jgi:nucleotide-binding universal stress UspA family protein